MNCTELHNLPRFQWPLIADSELLGPGVPLLFDRPDRLWRSEPTAAVEQKIADIKKHLGHQLRAGLQSIAFVACQDESEARRKSQEIIDHCKPFGQS